MLESPVLELQKQAGASVGEAHGWHVPNVYSSLEGEYDAATTGVGLVDRSYVGRIKITGEDGLDLLSRLSTNKLDDLEVGQMMGTVLTSNKGRIIDLLFVLRLEDRLLVMVSPQNRQKVLEGIDFYIFTEDVALEDVTEETSMLSLLGPKSSSLLDKLTGEDVSSLQRYDSISAKIGSSEALIVRTDFAGVQGYDIITPASEARQIWPHLTGEGEDMGVIPVGLDALEMVRIERGVPAYGKDMSESYNPLEANLREFISFNKGCYVGQEVVARLDTYSKVQKYLVGLSWDGEDIPTAGTNLYLDEKKVGTITSAARSSHSLKGVGLGYVRKAHAKPGNRLTAKSDDGEVAVQIEDLPFE